MDDNEHDPNLWQGRRKGQVESSQRAGAYAGIAFIVCIIAGIAWAFLWPFLSPLFNK